MVWVVVILIVLALVAYALVRGVRWYTNLATPDRSPQPPSTIVTITAARSQGGPPVGYVSPYLEKDRVEALIAPGGDQLPRLALTRHDGALWLTEPTTGKLVNVSDVHLPAVGIWAVRVRGDQYYDGVQHVQVGDPAVLVREPDNEYDANAVAITVRGRMLGHYDRGKARRLAKILDAGNHLEAVVVSVMPPKVIAAEPRILQHLLGGTSRKGDHVGRGRGILDSPRSTHTPPAPR